MAERDELDDGLNRFRGIAIAFFLGLTLWGLIVLVIYWVMR